MNGKIQGLIDNMNMLADRYHKPMIVAELSQPFTMERLCGLRRSDTGAEKGLCNKACIGGADGISGNERRTVRIYGAFLKGSCRVKDGLGIGYFY